MNSSVNTKNKKNCYLIFKNQIEVVNMMDKTQY